MNSVRDGEYQSHLFRTFSLWEVPQNPLKQLCQLIPLQKKSIQMIRARAEAVKNTKSAAEEINNVQSLKECS